MRKKYQIKIEPKLFGENKKYKLIGFPFYNEGRKGEFIKIFNLSAGSPFRREMRANKLIVFFCILTMSARLKELADLGTTLRACDMSGR
ncbi:hypothetical protein [Methermicoccus shengliensis]|uniref:hypothetical protein n=1 Tax=Methermicoccus shengliensis TaxID=660064 RepID=UPI0005B2C8D2|nr:hypothetical protein [Methermicoccus shengliensis]